MNDLDFKRFKDSRSILLLRVNLSNMPSIKPRKSRRRKQLKITDLPSEVLRRVASFVTCNLFSNDAENLKSAVALSQTCRKLYKAILESNNFRLVLSERTLDQQLPHLGTQILLFRPNIAHVNVDFDIDYIPHVKETPIYKQFKLGESILFGMLIAQTLRTAVIPDRTEYLFAIRHAKSLRNLLIRLYREPSPNVGDTIAILNLAHVSISNEEYFKRHPSGYPCLINIFRYGGGVAMYRSRCASVKSVGFNCRCADEEHFSLLTLLEAFENLSDIRISAKMSPSVASIFTKKNIQTVQLGHVHEVGLIAQCLAERITSVRSNAVLAEEDVYLLRNCPRLVVLSCRLKCGAEIALLRAVPMLTCLRSIQVSWLEDPSILLNTEASYGKKYTIRFGVMFHIARITRPSHLGLAHVRISFRELWSIFRLLGNRALNIHLNRVEILDKPTFQAMFLLIESLSVNCRNLRQLQLNLIPNISKLVVTGEEEQYRGSKLYQALDRIRRLAPRLKWDVLKRNIDDLVNYAYGIYDVLV